MNKIQKTILWIMGLAVAVILMFADVTTHSVGIRTLNNPGISYPNWSPIINIAIPILIIGSLLIYTLKSKR